MHSRQLRYAFRGFVLSAAMGCLGAKSDGPVDARVRVLEDGQPKPERLPRADDRLAVFHFWATWCKPCREELGDIARFIESDAYRALRKQGVRLYLISVDSPYTNWSAIRSRLQDWNIPIGSRHLFRVAVSGHTSELTVLERLAGHQGVPITVLVDGKSGRRRAVWPGRLDWAPRKIDREIRRHLSQ